ncbi:MAG: AsmA family protein [Bacteroidales bacterium]|nr:AsmA family protein [Bacteroidales bacterium]
MKKSLKIIAAVIVVIFLALLILPYAFKGKIKELVLKEANKSLNAELQVGPVRLSFIRSFPMAYVGLHDVIITGKGEFASDTLVSIKSLALSVGIMDLLAGSPYEIRKVTIDNADILLKVLADGQVNWDILKPSDKTGTEVEPDEFRLLLKSLIIKDSKFIYNDLAHATYIMLEGMDLSFAGDLTADFTNLQMQTKALKTYFSYDGMVYLRDAVIDWQADMDVDLINDRYTFRNNKLFINELGIVFDGSVTLPEEGYELDLSFDVPGSGFKQLLSLVPAIYTRDFASVQADGTVDFNGFVRGLYSDGIYPAFGINLLVSDGWLQYPGLPQTVKDININAEIENTGGDLDNTVIDIRKFTMDLAGNPLVARLLLRNPVTDPYIDTQVDARLNLDDIRKFYPLEEGEDIHGNILADFILKGRLSDIESGRYNAFEAAGNIVIEGLTYLSPYFAQKIFVDRAKIIITPAFLDIPEFIARAGQSDLTVKGKLENYLGYYLKGKTLRGNFNLVSTLLDVNELLTFTGETPKQEVEGQELTAFLVPDGIDFTLNANVGSVKYMNFDVRDFRGKILVKERHLILDNINMNMLGGSVRMNGFYETSDPVNPLVDFNLAMTKISIPETFGSFVMVERFAPIAEKVSGDISGEIKMAGLLDEKMTPRLETLTGLAKLLTSSLEVKNVNTLDMLADNLKMDQLRTLSVAGLSIVVQFMDGVMDVKPFDFKALGIDMNLGGQTSLDQRIGYVLQMKIPRSMMGSAANNVVDELFSNAKQVGIDIKPGDFINVNALIEGTITDPKLRLNLAGTGQDLVQSVKEQVEEKVEEIIDKAKEEAEKYLLEAGLTAQGIIDEAQRQADALLNSAQKLADETTNQVYIQADNIIKEATGQGALVELAAKQSADEVRKQGDRQAQNIMNEARQKSDDILENARRQAQQVREDAQKKINP